MSDPLQDSIGYLEARLAGCRNRPELHANQIDAYEFMLALASEATDGAQFMAAVQRTGNMVQVARAEAMDRHQALEQVYRAVGDETQAAAERLAFTAAEGAGDHAELNQRMTQAMQQLAQMKQNATGAAGQVRPLLTALLDWALQASPSAREGHRLAARQAWQQMLHHDPQLSWQRLTSYPPYRGRIPFDDARLAEIGQWFEEVIG